MTINIAIAGGGIAGLCLARGLSQHEQFKVTVYEGSQKYLDIGGGLAFHGNAIRALELIDPELQAEYFRRATVMHERDIEMATQVLVGDAEGPDGTPVLLAELGKAKGRKTVARCDLLDGLLSIVPEGIVQFRKKVVRVEEKSTGDRNSAPGSIHLTFQDGMTATTDVLIGCDGVHSVIRQYLLGAGHPAVGLKNHDSWHWITRQVPVDEANELNDNLLKSVPIFCGHGAYLNSMPTRFGKVLNICVVQSFKKDSPAAAGDSVEGETPFMVAPDQFSHWTKDVRDLVTLALRDPNTTWKLADHDHAPFYSRGNICMAGDAAHATMPFAGQGAAQSIEDAALLTALFAHVTQLDKQVETAFKVYDEMRRPRTQKVVEISRMFGRMCAFAQDGVGDDLDKLRAAFGAGTAYTNNVDLEGMHAEAVKKFKEAV